ncbi:hypothetical protein [Flavobacterium crassostreae]|uniref:Lipoprotein n=1 Tax=Flavobacterium crassostreae TaxID=1763534 RepID=A0A1B9E5K4_9FLAO|nr:hypothetical protein [Flavobacterium crassostreae]OCB77242.1 hypothetical protein LPBF_04375 [Flavobacterium crassostreae]
MKKTPFILLFFVPLLCLFMAACQQKKGSPASPKQPPATLQQPTEKVADTVAKIVDTVAYNQKMLALSNADTTGRWPVKTPYPLAGAWLPNHRIIAFYGNLYSTKMGILGAIPKEQMLSQLQQEVAKWAAADTTVSTLPALHYIAVTAQANPGKSNLYRMRMPNSQIDTVLSWAKPIGALVFLDIQVGHSNLKDEVNALKEYLKLPEVHLGIDPEFSLQPGAVPGTKIGTLDAKDINDAIGILAEVVSENNLPPKMLVVHRFTQGMVTNYQNIKTVPEVQIIMDMDGFGSKVLKKATYMRYLFKEPVQFTGFKLFYKNDNWNNWTMYTPQEVLQLTPKPIYIQYQ